MSITVNATEAEDVALGVEEVCAIDVKEGAGSPQRDALKDTTCSGSPHGDTQTLSINFQRHVFASNLSRDIGEGLIISKIAVASACAFFNKLRRLLLRKEALLT